MTLGPCVSLAIALVFFFVNDVESQVPLCARGVRQTALNVLPGQSRTFTCTAPADGPVRYMWTVGDCSDGDDDSFTIELLSGTTIVATSGGHTCTDGTFITESGAHAVTADANWRIRITCDNAVGSGDNCGGSMGFALVDCGCPGGGIPMNECIAQFLEIPAPDQIFNARSAICPIVLPEIDFEELSCFSEATTVQVMKDTMERSVSVKDLNVGDLVMTKSGKFQPIYAWAHIDRTKPTDFLQIHIDGETPLEITAEHMLFIEGKVGPVRAASVKAGDVLLGSNRPERGTGNWYKITHIDTVRRRGYFAPLTPDGTIVVSNSIVASTYMDVQGTGLDRVQFANTSLPFYQADVIHAFFSPLRLLCMGVSRNLNICNNNDDGMNAWGELGLLFHGSVEKQSLSSQVVLYSVLVVLFAPLVVVERLLGPAYGPAIAFLAFATISWWRRKWLALKQTKPTY